MGRRDPRGEQGGADRTGGAGGRGRATSLALPRCSALCLGPSEVLDHFILRVTPRGETTSHCQIFFLSFTDEETEAHTSRPQWSPRLSDLLTTVLFGNLLEAPRKTGWGVWGWGWGGAGVGSRKSWATFMGL